MFLQISEYYHHLFLEREKDVPVVAFIVYNGEDGWDAIDDAELKALSPITLVALTAMKYIWDVEKFSISFREAAAYLLKKQNTAEGRDFIKQSLSYFFWKWPYKSEAIKMDRPEAIANK